MALQRASLADQAADALADRIGAGEWPVGTPLPGEHALAAELGVGRSTVREAVRVLSSRGLVRARQGAGVFVTASTPSPDWDDLLRRTRVADVVEARVAIEVQAARLAAARRTPADLDALRAALTARSGAETASPPDDGTYVDADLRFHAAVVEAAHNPVLVELFAAFAPRVRSGMLDLLALAGPGSPHHHDHDAHAAIVRAVEKRDPDGAATAASDHLQGVLDALADTAAAPAHPNSPDPEETR
ncbi:FCD domain-containing protein [Luteimicrobium xylanilyticum]|uniref:Putative HTH-type transcriptional regulator YdfD n=1 Tax=Luteimicrobium xylanilyticum TaxID=1133546 RepID=A0A5P9QDN0_9MICO|nr:FCD domain-containing protein [Luteimicrobium xylanilyticum]QFU99150.1 putative HTH-type transcriptional regulator YdfD [Luteimicrobium xylanilyticum]